MAKELERAGIPTALITAMTSVGVTVGANRIVTGVRIPHVCGDPSLPTQAEKELRRKIIGAALKAVRTNVTGPTVFSIDS